VTGFTLLLAVGFSCYVFLYSSLLDPFTPTPNFTSSEEAIDSLVWFEADDGGHLKYDLDDSNDSHKYWLDMIGRNTKKNLHSR